jgi:uncharacterized protein YecE (DUF72 family)
MAPVRVGCSGWIYQSWRGAFYPQRCPQRLWLEEYAATFDTVEVNSTFYRLPGRDAVAAWPERTPEGFLFTVKSSRYLTHIKRPAVARWVEQTPPSFAFTVKASQYLTHMKRLTDMERGVERLWEWLEPLLESPKMGPVLWQLPERFRRDDERLAQALERLPPAQHHAFEFRHESWMADDVLALLREHGVALVIGDHPQRPWQRHELTADFTIVRFHYGARGRRGNYSDRELAQWSGRIAGWSREATVFAYFNNDWEAFAPRNAARLQALLGLR